MVITTYPSKRAPIIHNFNKLIDMDIPRILLLDVNIATMASVDLGLTRASKVILCQYFWVPGMAHQVTERARQVGQEKVVHVYQILENPSAIDVLIRDLRKPTNKPIQGVTRFYTRLDTDTAKVPDAPTREEYGLALKELSKNKEVA
ncbi:hypothetical protein N0V84_006590 [Fusarium piperis]|uniref:Helicase C-terminal domain-containing protein n=1 Tax=Fusarium piperis TaxID=1435070 RepID=A0A9W8WBJ2_9HYPO|nr:hypothetical protein N0V84_006590 [Fusarium piperis]